MIIPHEVVPHVYVRAIDRADNNSIPTPDDFNHIYGLVEDAELANEFSQKLIPDISSVIGIYDWMVIFTQSVKNESIFNFDIITYTMDHCRLVKEIVKSKISNAGECLVCSVRV